jgi:hypothetical protein
LIVLWEISRRDPTRLSMKSSSLVAEHSHGLRKIHPLATFAVAVSKKMPPIAWEVISYGTATSARN